VKKEFVGQNLSGLVIDIFNEFDKISGSEIPGLSVTINGFDTQNNVIETPEIRQSIDSALKNKKMQPIGTVANTIFPITLWNPNLDRATLFKRYEKVLPQLKKCPQNRYGIYFNRLVNYDDKGFNQLNRIIEFYQSGNRRRSAFQASIWDPKRDMVNTRMRGFPCLQHVVFSCVKKELVVTAFYATQYIFERAYGNFLGLCNLGKFMSHQMQIPIKEVRCFVGVEQLSINKSDLKYFLNSL